MTVGLVLVSHVPALADGLRVLVAQMAPDVVVEPAGGTDDGEVGTSFDLVVDGARPRRLGRRACVVLYDLGSALLTTETALELLDDAARERVRIAEAPFVEGAVAAGVRGAGRRRPGRRAGRGRGGRRCRRRRDDTDAADGRLRCARRPSWSTRSGLHARPAAVLARSLDDLDADVRVGPPGDQRGQRPQRAERHRARSAPPVQQVEYAATGPDAQAALDRARRR